MLSLGHLELTQKNNPEFIIYNVIELRIYYLQHHTKNVKNM